jgi:hypothetical protein
MEKYILYMILGEKKKGIIQNLKPEIKIIF